MSWTRCEQSSPAQRNWCPNRFTTVSARADGAMSQTSSSAVTCVRNVCTIFCCATATFVPPTTQAIMKNKKNVSVPRLRIRHRYLHLQISMQAESNPELDLCKGRGDAESQEEDAFQFRVAALRVRACARMCARIRL